jgi:THAP4-like, heme-binding beta-barrel domain
MDSDPPLDLGDAAASLHLGDTTGADFEPPAGADLQPALLPLSWLLGTWRGHGRGDYPTIEEFSYGQEITFSHRGKAVLEYVSHSWSLDADARPLAVESGFLRPQPDGTVEALITQASGVVEVSYGTIEGVKLELASDFVARTSSALDVSGLHRLYGLLEGVLLYAIDMSAVGQPLQPHLWGRLYRTRPSVG